MEEGYGGKTTPHDTQAQVKTFAVVMVVAMMLVTVMTTMPRVSLHLWVLMLVPMFSASTLMATGFKNVCDRHHRMVSVRMMVLPPVMPEMVEDLGVVVPLKARALALWCEQMDRCVARRRACHAELFSTDGCQV